MRSALAVALLLAWSLVMPMALSQTSPSDGVDYRLEITCPGQGSQCPVRAVDGADAMGDPALAVDPFRPTNLIIATLHGGGDNPDAPSPKSRSGLAFTTFTSTNGGVSWRDNPFPPPDQVSSMGRAWGETPGLTISPYGQAFVGSLYSVQRSGSEGHDYVLAAQKFRSIQAIDEEQDGDYNSEYLTSVYPGNAIRQMWYAFNTRTDNMTVVWTEHVTPHSSPAPEDMPRSAGSLEEAAGILEAAAKRTSPVVAGLGLRTQPAQDETGPMSVIGVSWTDLDPEGPPQFPDHGQLIGPCQTSTNPVIKEGWLYIGCKVAKDEGKLRWNPDAAPGDIEMFRMHPDGGVPEYLGPSPLSGGNPKLGVRSDGRIALLTTSVEGGRLVLDAAYGSLEGSQIQWSKIHHYGEEVPDLRGFRLMDANIQDLIYREYSGVLHIILKRNIERETSATNPARPFDATIHKSIVAIDEKHGFLDYHNLDTGNIGNRTDSTLLTTSDAAFNDITDDFLELPPLPHSYNGRHLGDSYQREFFAVGDYGQIMFAEIIELTELRGPVAAAVSLPPPPAPAPAPAAVSTTAVAGALSASGVTALTAARMRRKVIAGAKKKR